jgi:hypothetical protein
VRLSREKVNQLAHVVTHELTTHAEVTFRLERNELRLLIRQQLEQLLHAEEKLDAEARAKIAAQKREILEGSQEWDLLYRRHYMDALKKLGV